MAPMVFVFLGPYTMRLRGMPRWARACGVSMCVQMQSFFCWHGAEQRQPRGRPVPCCGGNALECRLERAKDGSIAGNGDGLCLHCTGLAATDKAGGIQRSNRQAG
jgi:hypothetical protein